MRSREPSVSLSDSTAKTRLWTSERVWQLALNALLLVVAAHSIALGFTLLFLPRWALGLVGWGYTGQLFWPCQAGLFLMILGAAYASAVRVRPLVWLVVGSKASAVVFLLLSVVWLEAPSVVPLLGIGDGLMGLAVAVAYRQLTKVSRAERSAGG
jgi:hypothetical protein